MVAATQATVDVIVLAGSDAAAARLCVERVLASPNATAFEVTVLIDADADVDIPVSDPRMTLLRERGTDAATRVNRAIARHEDRDVVLLQPYARVSGDWLDRLAAQVIASGAGVVVPFTDAVGSAVYAGASEAPTDDAVDVDTLDAVFARVNRGESASATVLDVPCLYVTRECLAAIGPLRGFEGDDGRAAGIDFAWRARERGFGTRIAGDVFVGSSAAGERATALDRHPAASALMNLYSPEVLRHRNESADFRRLAGRVDLARLAASPRPAILFIAHAWGGGIRRHMDDLTHLLRERADVLYLEPVDAVTVKLRAPLCNPAFAMWFRLPDELGALRDTLRAIGVVRLHFHHVHALPQAILQLPAACGLPYDCTLHDYYAICPQYHLADAGGRYCGEPDEAGCAACVGERPVQWGLDIRAWRAALGDLVRNAARVIAPSRDVASRIARHLPGVSIDVWPHAEPAPTPIGRVVRVVTLGNLSPEKGLRVVEQCARLVQRRGLAMTFRILGSTTEPLTQDETLSVHGSYEERSLPRLLAGERADVLFFPAQVPETYAYTLSVALAAGTPIVASALGAFPERLAGNAAARLVPWDAPAQAWIAALLDAAGAAANEPRDAVRASAALGGPPVTSAVDAVDSA